MHTPARLLSFSQLLAGRPLPIQRDHCFREEGWHVWCASVVRDSNGLYHLFYSRWPKSTGYDAWVTHSEIARATSDSMEGPFKHESVVFSKEQTHAWDADVFHNVTVKTFRGKYFMYYMGNRGNGEWWNHRNNQRIGVATADSPEGPWKRFSHPVLDVTPGAWDSLMVSNPTVTDTPDGRYLMIYKGVEKGPMPFGGRVLHGAAWAERPEGPFIKHPRPIMDQPGIQFAFEDPFLWREEDEYYCIVKDMRGYLSPLGETGLLLMHSTDGLEWKPVKSPIVIGRKLKFADNVSRDFARVERPQLFWDDETMKLWLLVAIQNTDSQKMSFTARIEYDLGEAS